MQLKEIHNFLKDLVRTLEEKQKAERAQKTLPDNIKEYTKGQLYEASYILEIVEKIIYDNKSHNF